MAETEQSVGCWLLKLTNLKSVHDTSVCMESMDRLPMRLGCGLQTVSVNLTKWSSVGSPQETGLNAEWVSETQTHFSTSDTEVWTAAHVLVAYHTLMTACSVVIQYITQPRRKTPQQNWLFIHSLLTKSNWHSRVHLFLFFFPQYFSTFVLIISFASMLQSSSWCLHTISMYKRYHSLFSLPQKKPFVLLSVKHNWGGWLFQSHTVCGICYALLTVSHLTQTGVSARKLTSYQVLLHSCLC